MHNWLNSTISTPALLFVVDPVHSRVLHFFLAAITFKSHTDDGERGIEISGPDWMGGGQKKKSVFLPSTVHRPLRPTILWSQNNPSPPPFACIMRSWFWSAIVPQAAAEGTDRQERGHKRDGRLASWPVNDISGGP